MRTVGSLLLTNSDFRLFLGDLNTIGRQVFADTAFALSNVAEETAKKIEPSTDEAKALEGPNADAGPAPTTKDLGSEIETVGKIVGDGLVKTGQEAISSVEEHFTGDAKDTLVYRLKAAVTKLRKRNDYSESVSTIGLLIKRYAIVYSRMADQAIGEVQQDVETNPEFDRAGRNFWSLLRSFGEEEDWDELEKRINKVMEHANSNPGFESLMSEAGNSVQDMLTNPDFFDNALKKFDALKEKSHMNDGNGSSLRVDIDSALDQARRTFNSIIGDKDVSNLIGSSSKILSILSPQNQVTNPDLVTDFLHVTIPLLIKAIQYVPIPRVQLSTPDIDLLLENLIIEPGKTVNNTSFLPYRLAICTQNDLEIRKAKLRTKSTVKSLTTIKIDGLSVRAEEIGFWLRAHSGLFRLADEGIASFELDDRGIDIHIDVEIGKDRLEKILSLRDVRVNIHHFSYTLRQSKFSWLAWLLKPLLRPIIRRTIQSQLAAAIEEALHFANRELLYARERLRATRIADPQDLRKFVQAVFARLTPEEDPDVYTAIGVRPSGDMFKGVYAPGSVVKLWEEEAVQAKERIEDFEIEGWRNEVFDVHAQYMV